MVVDLYKLKLKKTYKNKKGEEKHIITFGFKVGNSYIFIKPIYEEDYGVLDAFADFIDLNK